MGGRCDEDKNVFFYDGVCKLEGCTIERSGFGNCVKPKNGIFSRLDISRAFSCVLRRLYGLWLMGRGRVRARARAKVNVGVR